jgi:DNA-binding NarL/FixJ family response regulator
VTITVLLIDDHELIRQGLRRAFERDPGFQVVGEAGTLAAGAAAAAELKPQVALVDLNLPDGNGLDLVRTLRAQRPDLGLVVVTMYDDDERVMGALDAGASAFVNKNAPADEVLSAARHAAMSPTSFSAHDLAALLRRQMSPEKPRLTQREAEILDLLKDGLSVAAVSRKLYISESTTKTHMSKLYEKLGANNRTQAIMEALRLGLIKQNAGR